MSKSNEEIVQMLDDMDEEAKAMEKELIHLAWAMRGISLNEVYAYSPSQRQHVAEMYKSHLETTKDTGLPFF